MAGEIQDIREADNTSKGENLIRRGLLYMLLGATAYYFATGSSTFAIPVEIPTLVAQVWIPLLFLSGLGYTLFSFFRPATETAGEQAPANI